MPELENEKPELNLVDAPPEPPKTQTRPLRRRKFKIKDNKELATWILNTHNQEIQNRNLRTQMRKARRNKLMGWMAPKVWPWKNAAQVFLPIMQIVNLKIKGTIENALKSIRPMCEAKAKQKRNAGNEEAINSVLDYQFFIENAGESNIDTFTTNFVEDEAVYGYIQYVKERQTYHDVRRLPAIDPAEPIIVQFLVHLETMYGIGSTQSMKDEDGYEWEVIYLDDEKKKRTARVSFYDTEDGEIDACIVTTATVFDGPSVRILDFDDVIFPSRSANLQPPSGFNPEGAPWVDMRFRANLDTIKRRVDDKTYDQVSKDDWENIRLGKSIVGSGEEADEEKRQKDEIEGTEDSITSGREDRSGIMRFCRLDVNGDGLDEDVIVWILEKPEVTMKVALLSEIYPGLPIKRPIIHNAYIRIPNRVLGISNSEFVESLQDGMQTAIEQHLDWGTLTNMPWFTYRAGSGMKAEPIYLEPGIGIPLDDPQHDLQLPSFPNKDSTFSLNTITLLQQFVEMIEMQSQASYGRVPTGKASAFRTQGTTLALLGQADSRAEQVLRRVFEFYGDVFELMHRLNRRFLPAVKEIRTIGFSEKGESAYVDIKREDLNVDVDWEFKATLLNTNKQVLSQSLTEIISLAFTPLAYQAGLTTLPKMYQLLRDKTKALDFDPDKYWQAPPDPMPGPKLMAEDVIAMILNNEVPQGGPVEPAQEHLAKLQNYMQNSMALGFMNPMQTKILQNWLLQIAAMVQQEQQMMAAMQQFSQGGQSQGGQGPGGPPSLMQTPTMADNPGVRPNELIDESAGGGVPQ